MEDDDGRRRSTGVPALRALGPPMSSDAAPQEPFAAPDDHAIVVGINHYRPGFPALQGCINDAELFREWLVSPLGGGLNPANVQPLLSQQPADPDDDAAWQPVRDTIYTRLRRFRNRFTATGQRVGRRLYLFYAGHGVAWPNRPFDSGLVLSNSELPEPLYAIPGRQIIEAMQRDRTFEELVVFMDCCAEVRGTGSVDAQTLDLRADPDYPLGANNFCGRAAGWNASTGERMLDHPRGAGRDPLLQGVFTHALLTVLWRTAAGVEVRSDELGGHVIAEAEALDPCEERRPRFYPSEEHAAPIVFAARTAQPVDMANADGEVTVVLSDPARGLAVIGGDAQTVVLNRPGPVRAEQSIRLAPGIYEFRPASGPPPDPAVLCKVVATSSGAVIRVQL